MYGLVKSNSEPTPQQVEDQLDGNLCRFWFSILPSRVSSLFFKTKLHQNRLFLIQGGLHEVGTFFGTSNLRILYLIVCLHDYQFLDTPSLPLLRKSALRINLIYL